MAPVPGRPADLVPVLRRAGGVSGVDPQLRLPVRARPAADRGVLQRAVLELGEFSLEETDRLVFLRKERQRRFTVGSLRLWAVIDEMALRRPVGNRALMRAQLEYLLEISDRPGLTLQVTPYPRGASYLVPGSFSILRFATADLPPVVYVEQLTSAMYLDKRPTSSSTRRPWTR